MGGGPGKVDGATAKLDENKTYRLFSPAVSTVKKSVARI